MIKRCPKNCYVTDKDVLRCPRCGNILLKAGNDKEAVLNDIQKIQKDAWANLKGKDFERIPELTRQKERLDEEEKKYFNLRK